MIKVGGPALPGTTTTGSSDPIPTAGSTVYGVLTLGNDPLGVAKFFDQEFAFTTAGSDFEQIPVTRLDISGYGTSMFSDWMDQDLKTIGVRRAHFDVLLGRTAVEIVQIASIIAPYCIRMTRSVIFDRQDSGLVVRHDTGWKAIGSGSFELLQPDQKLLGAVDHLENIRNITVGTGPAIASSITPAPIVFVPVTFDADLVMNASVTAVSHGKTSPVVAGTQFQGYAPTDGGRRRNRPSTPRSDATTSGGRIRLGWLYLERRLCPRRPRRSSRSMCRRSQPR